MNRYRFQVIKLPLALSQLSTVPAAINGDQHLVEAIVDRCAILLADIVLIEQVWAIEAADYVVLAASSLLRPCHADTEAIIDNGRWPAWAGKSTSPWNARRRGRGVGISKPRTRVIRLKSQLDSPVAWQCRRDMASRLYSTSMSRDMPR